MKPKINVPDWEYPVPKDKAMNCIYKSFRNIEDVRTSIYYIVLGEDLLRGSCQICKRIHNMEFGWKSQGGVPLFVCTNILQIKPTIETPIEWNSRLNAKSECPMFDRGEKEK